MKTGVSMSPCAVERRPRRAAPSRANTSKPTLMVPSPPAWGEKEGTRLVGDGEGEVGLASARTSPPHPDPLLRRRRRGRRWRVFSLFRPFDQACVTVGKEAVAHGDRM